MKTQENKRQLIASSVMIRGHKVIKILRTELKTTTSSYELSLVRDNIVSLETLIVAGNVAHVDMIAKSYGL